MENIELPMVLAGMAVSERKKRVEEAIEAFGLSNRARHRPDELSGGQRQRVAIARATIMQPHILLADEPTGNLDSATGEEILALFRDLHDEGRTILMVTHEIEVARQCQSIIHIVITSYSIHYTKLYERPRTDN